MRDRREVGNVFELFAGIGALVTAVSFAYVRVSQERRAWYLTRAAVEGQRPEPPALDRAA